MTICTIMGVCSPLKGRKKREAFRQGGGKLRMTGPPEAECGKLH
jgi:hypothetical protein